VHGRPLDEQPLALGHPEAVLFVDHCQLQALEDDVVLKERVGADDDLDLAGGEPGQLLLAGRALVAAGDQHRLDPMRRQRSGDGFVVLAGEDLGRRHEGGLAAARRDVGHGAHRHHRLARADIPLNQPAHPLARGEVGANLGERPLLGAGEGERQVGADRLGQSAGCNPGGG
jgi:hypothetical protein